MHMQNKSRVKIASRFTDFDIQLFKSGKHFRLYEKLGSHLMEWEGEQGTYFAVWAPNAKSVSVIGNFNEWKAEEYNLSLRWDNSGIWEGFIPNVGQGTLYKYHIISYNDLRLEKADPFAKYCENPPKTASVVWGLAYEWKDKNWMSKRDKERGKPKPFSVYEVHLGSWKKFRSEQNRSLSYRELALELVAYVAEMGFTHVELMPVMEHPYYASWGYQLTGYFAPSARYGNPEEFMMLVDAFHQQGIGVILDWVPSHFPEDGHGLAFFDGTHLYDHSDPRQGFHPDWKSCIFNLGRNEVCAFLISNALFWLDQYHIDGLRVDAVASMLYLDYSRDEGQWIPNKYGGRENLESIEFLKNFNETVYLEYPSAITIAEESTAWPSVSKPTFDGGLGFGQKWMMGWMHDTLAYMERALIYRQYHQNDLSFSLVYAFSENFMLPLSHDEVVHGKGSLINKMPGDEWQRFAQLRLLYGYMFTHPGTQLLFMGGEFGQTQEWSHDRGLDWELLQYAYHQNLQHWVKSLNKFYSSHASLYFHAFSQEGFEWIDYGDNKNSVFVYLRKGSAQDKPLLVVCNFNSKTMEGYKLGVPQGGTWVEMLNSDDASFGGSGVVNAAKLKATKKKQHGKAYQLDIVLSPLAIMIFEPLKLSKPKVVKATTNRLSKKK
ncbi:MAG: 1,4-alpha-glucan branching protein GlgB [Saprospiraceae bacterium]